MYQESESCKKTAFLLCVRAARAKTRGRTRTRGKFENAQNGLKCTLLYSKLNFRHFKILTRAYARVMTRMKSGMQLTSDMTLKFMHTKFHAKMSFNLGDMANHVTKDENHKMAPTRRHA